MCNPAAYGAFAKAIGYGGQAQPAADPNAGTGHVAVDPATGRPTVQGFVAQPSAMPTPPASQPADQLRGAVGNLFMQR